MQVAELDSSFAAQIISDLRAGLAPSRIDSCQAEPLTRKPPLATVKIAPTPQASTTYSIDVSDSLTQKRIGRDIDLEHVPEDGRAFALAVAAEELLRASWAELALTRDKPPPAKPLPPPAPAPAKPVVLEPPAPRDFSALGLGLGIKSYTGGQLLFGIEAFWLTRWFDRFGFGIALGGRRGLSVEAPSGRIRSRSIDLEISLRPTLSSAALYRIDTLLALSGSRVWFFPEPAVGASGARQSSQTLFARAGLVLTLGHMGSLRSVSALGLGTPLRSFSASDGSEVVTGISGLEVFAGSGIALEY